MIELSPIVAVLYVGLLISALILFCLVGIYWGWKKNQVRELGQSIGQSASQPPDIQQLESMGEWLSESYGLDESSSEEIIRKLTNQEKVFFQALRTSVIQQNNESFQKVTRHYDRLKDIFTGIKPEIESSPEIDPEILQQFEQEVTLLKEQASALADDKQQLTSDLQTANDTLNSVIDEYSMMFGQKEDTEALMQSKAKMIQMLEQSIHRFSSGETEEGESNSFLYSS